jgi:hypothetical protein
MAAMEPNSTLGVLGIQQHVLRREEEKMMVLVLMNHILEGLKFLEKDISTTLATQLLYYK